MSQKITAQLGPTITLEEAVAGALTGKEDLLISVNNVGKAVLFDGTYPAIGVMEGKLAPASTAVRVRLLSGGGTVRIIQNAAVTPGARVAGVNANGRVITVGAAGRSLGVKISDFAGAAGDVIEVIPLVEYAP